MCSLKNLVKVTFCSCLIASTTAYAAIQTLMQIPGIDGEYVGAGFENWIEINHFSGVIEEGGCDVFTVGKALDSTSAQILGSTALRSLFDEIVVVVRAPGGDGTNFTRQRITLRNSAIAAVTTSVSAGDDFPQEDLLIEAESLRLQTYRQQNDGTVSLIGVADVDCGKIKK